ncbi:ATP-dependent DNA ligase [Amycolatopsis panacis]|uniref:ATP-dependent DNA ligase n=1 Tax=Amycolatopsis panacis TaxID=2340917 RepID=UPI001F47DFA5|nr:ATP-dependent DNA ligase [Amycolatopsis panacis]
MQLPVMPPVRPMLAKAVREVPRAAGLRYEPKWDGFRCVVFRDGDEVELGSRNDRPLTRYFPELTGLLREALPTRCVVDGEIVLVTSRGLDFGALQLRLHPAASRVRKLAAETPASFVAFDLLALGDDDLTGEPFARRRELLEGILGSAPEAGLRRVHLTPLTTDPDVAHDWFTRFEGAGFDGVMAKPADQPYEQDRRVMWKVKHERTADCVIAGFRWHKDGQGVGSLLLGLYDDTGTLHHVGVASSFTKARRGELVAELAPWRENALDGHPWRSWAEWQGAGENTSTEDASANASTDAAPGKGTSTERDTAAAGEGASAESDTAATEDTSSEGTAAAMDGTSAERDGTAGRDTSADRAETVRRPGASSRWAPGKDLSWEPLRPERVAEVRYEHLQGGRFRHGGRLVRFRPDRDPESCTYAQLAEAPPAELADLFGEAK